MYQTVGHNAIDLYAEAMDLPLYRGTIQGSSVDQGKVYTENQGDEVEDLYKLLKNIKVFFVLLTCTIFSLQYQYDIKQTSDENKEIYQLGDY